MKNEEPKPIRDIRTIRQSLYEETRDMTAGERIARTKEKGDRIIKEYGLKTKEDSLRKAGT